MMSRLMGWLVMALAIAATPARAEWMRAETKHFVVYEDAKPEVARKLATDLERFDSIIRLFYNQIDRPGAESNKLTVYVVSDVTAVQRLCGNCANVYGFYDGRASGSMAFTPKTTDGGGPGRLSPQVVLFHEYAHHFLLGNFALAYPAWFSEGFAEFVATTTITDKNLTVGVAANHRAYSVFDGPSMPARLLFDPAGRKRLDADEIGAIYARGWLLTHWIMFNSERRAKLQRYVIALNNGTPSLKAATDAFGDLDALDKELRRYLAQSTLPGLILKPDAVPMPTVTVAPVSPGVEAMLEYRMVSARGVNQKTAPPLYRRAAPIAAKFPDDAVVQGWFAEMAFDAGEEADSAAAADRALAVDPKSIQALLYKGRLAQRAAMKSKAPADWKTAREFFVRANRIDPDKAMPLELFYLSYEAEGTTPRASAVAGLLRAQELVPQDPSLRTLAARQLIRDSKLPAARAMLAPLAYNPHAPADNPGTRAITALDAKDGPGALKALEGGKPNEKDAPADPD